MYKQAGRPFPRLCAGNCVTAAGRGPLERRLCGSARGVADDLLEDDVLGAPPRRAELPGVCDEQLAGVAAPRPGHRDVELAVSEAGLRQVDADPLQRLPLRLVDGERPGRAQRVLPAHKGEGDVLRVGGRDVDPGQVDGVARGGPGGDGGEDAVASELPDDESRPVGEAVLCGEVAHEDDGRAELEAQGVRRQLGRVD